MTELSKFNPLKSEIASLVAPTLTIKVTDFASSQAAIEAAKTIKEMSKRVDELRKEEVGPLNTKVKQINEYAKQVQAPLEQAETHIRSQLNAFAFEQEKIRVAALKRAEDERKQKEAELLAKQAEEKKSVLDGAALFGADEIETAQTEAIIEEKHATEQAVANSEAQQAEWNIKQMQLKNTRKTTKVRVLDLTQVPREFLIIEVNEKAAVAAHKAGVKIAGLEFYEEINVAIGQKTRVTRESLEASNG